MDRFQIGTHFLALAAAFALAVPIGWDREKRAQRGPAHLSAGRDGKLRFVQASENLLVHSPDGMAKVIEGLITGIGFIAARSSSREPPACGPPARSAFPSGSAATTSQ
ncbi:putative membrane protein YhiD involved in acid resistance [Bradyrhizobium algeriense]|uniref:Membrane protein YhiD involved in acid resistance n=1 Tax=Bradyrhizobium algeriense TaxID=634784 RepID=A0ABU8BE15_9BRAD